MAAIASSVGMMGGLASGAWSEDVTRGGDDDDEGELAAAGGRSRGGRGFRLQMGSQQGLGDVLSLPIGEET